MLNLAGQTTGHANAYIEDELTEAHIHMLKTHVSKGEVRASIVGSHGLFEFVRAWSYWIVKGPVPIDIAWEMYCDPRGKDDVRVAGHCGCPEPIEPWIEIIDGKEYVTLYHIDTQDGLNLFAEKVLGSRPSPPTEAEKEAAKEIARANHTGIVIVPEDSPTEEEYLDAVMEIADIRHGLTNLRSRLKKLGRGADKRHFEYESTANTVAGVLTMAIVYLSSLQKAESESSFIRRAQRVKKMWEDLYKNPDKYVLREER